MQSILARILRILVCASFLSFLAMLGLIVLEGNRGFRESYRAIYEMDPFQAVLAFLTCFLVGLLLDVYVHDER